MCGEGTADGIHTRESIRLKHLAARLNSCYPRLGTKPSVSRPLLGVDGRGRDYFGAVERGLTRGCQGYTWKNGRPNGRRGHHRPF